MQVKHLEVLIDKGNHVATIWREEKRIQLVLLTSDRGLCGGYNANLIRAAEAFRREQGPEKEVQLTLIGRRGADYFRRRRAEISDRYVNILATPPEELAAEIAEKLINRFVSDETDAVYILYSSFRSALSQVPTLEKLLPVSVTAAAETEQLTEYLYEPGIQELLASLLPKITEVAWRAHDGHGFRDDERIEDDGDTDLADEPRASGFDHTRADGDRRYGGSFEVRNGTEE